VSIVLPVVDLELRFVGSSRNIAPAGSTGHYFGPTPWGAVDRSSPARFAASTNHARCPSIVRAAHDFHLSKGWFGLAYSSVVCPHGGRYEGRGPGYRTGANGNDHGNFISYAILGLIGDDDPLSDAMKLAYLAEAERLRAPLRWDHSDWTATSCAGAPFRVWKAAGFPSPADYLPSTPTTEALTVAQLLILDPDDGQTVWRTWDSSNERSHVRTPATVSKLRFFGVPYLDQSIPGETRRFLRDCSPRIVEPTP